MKHKKLYLECYSGISGDMTVAALLDLGADQNVLMEGLNSLKVDGYSIKIGRRDKNSISACDFDVILEEDAKDDHQHTHDRSHSDHQIHSYEHTHEPSREASQDDEPSHTHNHKTTHSHELIRRPIKVNRMDNGRIHRNHDHKHDYNHDHDHVHQEYDHIHLGHHEHRNLNMINDIIESSSITENAKAIAKRIFYIVATAEAKAHGKPIEEVHFHEVGAIDSIVDIVAAAICLDNLDIKDVIVSELSEGTGFINCQHGTLPIPVPAVINIASEHQLPLHITKVKGELVTPTGAAIAAAIRTEKELPKEMRILKIGLGAGKRNYEGASGLLRAMLIEDISANNTSKVQTTQTDHIWVLEANIDDCSGEALAYTMELLLRNGAKDAYYTPIFMKKNRPAYLLGVLCKEEQIPKMEQLIFTNTTTIGIRRYEAMRTILNREIITVTTAYGDAQVKVCTYEENKYFYPEYESVKKLCENSNQDYMTMYHLVQSAAIQQSSHTYSSEEPV